MTIQITSPLVSVSSRIKEIRNREMDNVSINNNNSNLNNKRNTLSSSVPSIHLTEIDNKKFSNKEILFENEINLKNKVSKITKKFDMTSGDSQFVAQHFKSKAKRREIFSSNRNITLPENREKCTEITDFGGSWSKVGPINKNHNQEEKNEGKKKNFKLSIQNSPELGNYLILIVILKCL